MDWSALKGVLTIKRILNKDINRTLKELYKDVAAVRAINPDAEFEIEVEGLTIDLKMRDINE